MRTRSRTGTRPGRRAIYTWGAVLLLGILFAQVVTSIPRLSITFDEDVHLSTGYAILRTGDLRLVEDHPPLLEMWMGWPLLLSDRVPDPPEVPTWDLGDRRLFVRNQAWWQLPIDVWLTPARIPVAWLAVLLGALLFRWSSEWFGPRAGLLALALFAFDPNVLAHSSLATLDLGVTGLIFATMYLVDRTLRHPSPVHLGITGALLGLALSAKISAAILLPVSVGLILFRGVKHWPGKLAGRLALTLGTAGLAWWAVHLFQFGPPRRLPFPLPAPTYWTALLRVAEHVSGGDRAYLLGETYQGGRWIFFPVALALKTPLPTLILLTTTTVSLWRRPKRWWRELVLSSLPLSYLAISLTGSINLGYRHLLPILPFIYLSVSRLAAPPPAPRPERPTSGPSTLRSVRPVPSLVLVLLLLWQAVGTLRIWPFHLTYFNEVAGGPQNGYKYMADSNVDWGQGLKALRDTLEDQPLEDVRLSSFVFFIRPEVYDIQATPLPPLADAPPVLPARFNPQPGTYVISASTLRGLLLVDPETYNWFWHREPDRVVANAMPVYRVTEREPAPTWVGRCSGELATPLSPAQVAAGFGQENLRLFDFDCNRSWLYPDGGRSNGWTVLHRETVLDPNPFTRRQLARARLSFEQTIPQETPPLSIYEWNASPAVPPDVETAVWAAPVAWPPAQAMAEGTPLSAPVELDGPLTFLGYEVTQAEGTVTLVTAWRVAQKPDRPFSLMGHLVNDQGQTVAVADGLGVVWDQLEPGDVILQQHPFVVPADLPEGTYWPQTGAYWTGTVPERWAITLTEETTADRLLLPPLPVLP